MKDGQRFNEEEEEEEEKVAKYVTTDILHLHSTGACPCPLNLHNLFLFYCQCITHLKMIFKQ